MCQPIAVRPVANYDACSRLGDDELLVRCLSHVDPQSLPSRSGVSCDVPRLELAPLRKRIHEIAEAWMRYGCRRIHVPVRREGLQVNVKRVHWLY
jgi:hypothetical protein